MRRRSEFVRQVLDQRTVEEVQYPVGVGRIVLRVGDHDDRRPFAVQFRKKFHYLLSVFRIEVSGRLVGQYELRVGDDGACDGYALLLTAGELLREVFGAVRDVHAVQNFGHAASALRSLHAQIDERQLDILEDVKFVDEVERLEYEADIALAEQRAILFTESGDLLPEQGVAAGCGIVEQAEDCLLYTSPSPRD